ncbi:MAG: penicillin-binding protein [Fibrobacterales bacterium]|nr:penicillin-binding protein [Fibrobacterales bacterium]
MSAPSDRFDVRERKLPLGRLLLLITAGLLVWKCNSPAEPPEEESDEPVASEAQGAEADSGESGAAGDADTALGQSPEESFADSASTLTSADSAADAGFAPGAPPSEPGEPDLWADPEYLSHQKDTALGRVIAQLLLRHHPDGAIWLMADGSTNELLAWGQYNDSALQRTPHFASRATFPAASIAKTVTAAAGFEHGLFAPTSTFPLVGRAHTLYNRQLKVKEGQGTPISVSQAFARSMNPPMALMGMRIGAPRLKETARKLGFGLDMPERLPERSNYSPPDTGYGLAEVSCGFTQSTTLSPAQAAGMAFAVLSGKPWTPAWSALAPERTFPRRPVAPVGALKASTAKNMRLLFEETATSGTARKSLRKTIFPNWRDRIAVGGKTGSLDGSDPQGRYDWFVGYAYDKEDPKKSVVVVVMQYHRRLRSLPASQVTGVLLNYWAKYYLDAKKPSRAANGKKRG